MANYFVDDPNCVALWNFEAGELTTDSIGTNTLTDYNAVGMETSDYKQGLACADFERDASECLYINDANLDSNFPFKDGDLNKQISVCGWFKIESIGSSTRTIFSKDNPTTDNNSLWLGVWTQSYVDKFFLCLGYDLGSGLGTSEDKVYINTSIQEGRWYHFGVTVDANTKAWRIRIWDDTAQAIHASSSGTATNDIYIGNAKFVIGGRNGFGDHFDGLIDEVVVFKDILTTDEIDEIRQGEYGEIPAVIDSVASWNDSDVGSNIAFSNNFLTATHA